MPPKKKGFVISSPMIGLMIFLIGVLIAAAINSENDSRIDLARSSDNRDRLEFITSAIRADSYDVLLQRNLEVLTVSYLQDEYHLIRANDKDKGWEEALEDELSRYYEDSLGEALGISLESYRDAYKGVTGVKDCKIERAANVISRPGVSESKNGDGTLEVTGESYGERIICTSEDPPAKVEVDILGRAYTINVRLRDLYDIAKEVLWDVREIINDGTDNIEEPLGVWEGHKWFEIQKSDNKIIGDDAHFLENLVQGFEGSWADEINRITKSSLYFAKKDILSRSKYEGMSVPELEILSEEGGEFSINDFEVSCVLDESGQYRNCLPFNVRIILGDTLCELGSPPENSQTGEFYNLQINPRCNNGLCPNGFDQIMSEIVSPLKSVCADYYATANPATAICKKWEGKARSVMVRGVVEDENQQYNIAESNGEKVTFRFMDYEPEVSVQNIKANRLSCGGFSSDEDRYKDNVRIMLESTEIMISLRKEVDSNLRNWMDIGSKISQLADDTLTSAYEDIYGKDGMPKPCFISGVKASSDCADTTKPRLEIDVDWEQTRENCIERADDLCTVLCGGSADISYKEAFCNSLFSERGVSIGSGTLSCVGGFSCKDTEIQIDQIKLIFNK